MTKIEEILKILELTIDLPEDIDDECKLLCGAVNSLAGIRTVESCCGHGERPYRIYFEASSLAVLPRLLYWFDVCHCGDAGWRVIAQTDCAMSPVTFVIEGPVGAYRQSEEIAALIAKELKEQGK